MTNETAVKKIQFDTLEVGCKYESRCGEVWEVSFYRDDCSDFPYGLKRLDDGYVGRFTSRGYFFKDRVSPNDLFSKIII